MTDDYETLARLDGTLIFLMGLSHLQEIAARLMRYGKAGDTPAAVIADGSTPFERIVRGTLLDICGKVQQAGLSSPAVIVVGETASLCFRAEPESVRRYGMVGTSSMMQAFAQALGKGGRLVPLIRMEVERQPPFLQLCDELGQLSSYGWIFFTSRQAVELFFAGMREREIDFRTLAGCRFGVIGQGTAQALLSHGFAADFVPEEANAESFAKSFLAQSKSLGLDQDRHQGQSHGLRILLPRAKRGNPALGQILREAGYEVAEFCIYDVVPKRREAFARVAELTDFVFFSASGAEAFFAELRAQQITLAPGTRLFCMGRVTAAALEAELAKEENGALLPAGGRIPVITAEHPTAEGLAVSVCG